MSRLYSAFNSLPAALLLIVVSLAAFIAWINLTSPIAGGPVGAMLAFLFLYGCSFGLALVGLHWFVRLRRHGSDAAPVVSGRSVTAGALWAIAPIVVMALNSTGQLDAISIMLIIIFEVLAGVYVFRR